MPSAGCFTSHELEEIVARSSTLAERLSGSVVPTGRGGSPGGERLGRWKRAAANGDPAVFQDLLGHRGVGSASDRQLSRLLGKVRHPPGAALPSWTAFLGEIPPALAAAFSGADLGVPRLPSAARRSIPFAGLYWPIAVLARRKVEAAAAGSAKERIGEEAWTGLSAHLLSRLSTVCSLALQPRFQAFAAIRQSGAAFSFFGEEPPPGRGTANASIHGAFVAQQGADGMVRFFLEYPVAARLVAQVTLFWIGFVREFLARLDADAAEISARFFDGRPLGALSSIKAGVSDPHHGGRSVLILHFAGGLSLVYKPRPMQIDAGFFDLLKWWNTQSRQPPLRTLEVLVREDYGWENFVEAAPCQTQNGGKRFYRRAGALLCLLHALRGIDFHYENMIACRDDPIMVDLEALCHPEFPVPVIPDGGDGPTGRLLDSSVLRTGMLPLRERSFGEQRVMVRSALGAPRRQWSFLAEVHWKRIGSDAMEAFRGLTRRDAISHQPRYKGRMLSVRSHLADLVYGFQRTAGLLESRPAISAQWGARIEALRHLRTRYVERPTLVYATLIRYSLEPRLLREGVDRSIELEVLPNTANDGSSRRAEIAAMEALDIPYFSRTAGGIPYGQSLHIQQQLADIRAAVHGKLTLQQGRIHRVTAR